MKDAKFKLTERDSLLFLDLLNYRYLSISQVQSLHFPSLQTAYRRMRVLKDAGIVNVFQVPNIEESIFFLSSKGYEQVSGIVEVDRFCNMSSVTKSQPKDYYFMRHFLAINDFRIMLKHSCQQSGIRLLGFIPEYYARQSQADSKYKYIRDSVTASSTSTDTISHTPDGVFALQKDGRTALFFLEIDCGTEVVSDLKKGVLKSLNFYTRYLLAGSYQRFARDFEVDSFKGFRALYLTNSKQRAENIRQSSLTLTVPEKAKRFLWITTNDKLESDKLFDLKWHSIDPKDDAIYRIE